MEQGTDASSEERGLWDFDGAEQDAGEFLHRERAIPAPRRPGEVECQQQQAWCSDGEGCIAMIVSFSSGIR